MKNKKIKTDNVKQFNILLIVKCKIIKERYYHLRIDILYRHYFMNE